MRRQRVLRSSSAQSLCFFCACRLGVQVLPAQVAPLIPTTHARSLNTKDTPLRQSAAVAPSNDNGGSHGPSFVFDPESSLTLAEQREKARRVQGRQEQEAAAQKLRQEREIRQPIRYSHVGQDRDPEKDIEGNQRRGARHGSRDVDDSRNLFSPSWARRDDGRQAIGRSAFRPDQEGTQSTQTLGQAMSSERSRVQNTIYSERAKYARTLPRAMTSERQEGENNVRAHRPKATSTSVSRDTHRLTAINTDIKGGKYRATASQPLQYHKADPSGKRISEASRAVFGNKDARPPLPGFKNAQTQSPRSKEPVKSKEFDSELSQRKMKQMKQANKGVSKTPRPSFLASSNSPDPSSLVELVGDEMEQGEELEGTPTVPVTPSAQQESSIADTRDIMDNHQQEEERVPLPTQDVSVRDATDFEVQRRDDLPSLHWPEHSRPLPSPSSYDEQANNGDASIADIGSVRHESWQPSTAATADVFSHQTKRTALSREALSKSTTNAAREEFGFGLPGFGMEANAEPEMEPAKPHPQQHTDLSSAGSRVEADEEKFSEASNQDPRTEINNIGGTNRSPQYDSKANNHHAMPFEQGNSPAYRTLPFDAQDYQQEPGLDSEDNTATWQHLRRRPAEPTPLPAVTQQNSPLGQETSYGASPSFDDPAWVDRMFDRHKETRPYAPPPPPAQNMNTRDNRPLTDRTKMRENTKCARCGQLGHFARECRGPVSVCNVCGQQGHNAKFCPTITCHVCGQKGHIAAFCPNRQADPRGFGQRSSQVDETARPEYFSARPGQQGRAHGPRNGRHADDPFADSRGRAQALKQPEQRSTRIDQYPDARPMRSNPFSGSDSRSQSTRFVPQGHQPQDDGDGKPTRETGREFRQAEAASTPAATGAEEDTRRQEARAARRNQKWAVDEEQHEQDRSSRYAKDRKERRGGRRVFDEDQDEEAGAREEYRARKAERQQQEQAAADARQKAVRQRRQAQKSSETTPITLPEWTSVQQLSQLLDVRYEQFVERLEDLGYDDIFPGKTLDSETSGMIAMEYNFEPSFDAGAREETERDLKAQPDPEDKELLPTRPPVVTIMGHVDHGKTTILDYLRKSSVAAGEAGGITQHIGAFSIPLASSGKTVTFLDTPGHAAFLAMRQRGANVTDIVVLVVAADDGVKPQTLEALKHAKSAGVPMIVAINKVDKEEADIDRCKQDLARHGVEIEDFGGETQVVCVSGKTGKGMNELEENVATLSEILDHRADVQGGVEGWVLEATTKKSGRVATVLVRRGTLQPGCVLVAGRTWARVKTLRNEAGVAIHEVGPGMPVEVDGWRDQPFAGDEVLQAENEQHATSVVDYRLDIHEREKIAQDTEAINQNRRLEQERRQKEKMAEAAAKREASAASDEGAAPAAPTPAETVEEQHSGQITVPFIIKADVSGSAEAVSAYILSVSNPLIAPKILYSEVGPIHESDIDLANAASGHIIAFNLPPNPDMNALAEHRGVKMLENNIIYRVLDDVKAVLEDKLPPIISQRVLGEAEIAAEFEIGVGGRKKIKIAGCKIRNGVVSKGAKVRVTRKGEKVYEGIVTSLKNVKKDVSEMRKGTECGMGFEGWEGFESGDQVQTFVEISEKRAL